MTGPPARGGASLVLLDIAVALGVIALLSVIAANLEAIPVPVFFGGFTALTVTLAVMGVRRVSAGRPGIGRIFCLWSGVAYGIAVFSGAQLFDLTAFVPTLVLLWAAGLAALAILSSSAALIGLAGVTNAVWMGLVFLFDLSYLPGLALLSVVLWFIVARRPSTVVFGLTVLGALWLANLLFYDVIHPAHFPLSLSAGHAPFTLAVVGAAHGLAGLARWRAAPAGVAAGYADALATGTAALGATAALAFATPGVWAAFVGSADPAAGLGLSLVILAVGAVVLVRPAPRRARVRFGVWLVAWLVLAASAWRGPSGALVPLVAAALATGIGADQLARGASSARPLPTAIGALLVVMTTVVLPAAWGLSTGWRVILLGAAAAGIYLAARRAMPSPMPATEGGMS